MEIRIGNQLERVIQQRIVDAESDLLLLYLKRKMMVLDWQILLLFVVLSYFFRYGEILLSYFGTIPKEDELYNQ